jgi:hypothetical protein
VGLRFSRTPALWLGATTLLLCSAEAGAVSATSNATGTATVLHPLTVVKASDLDFGNVIVRGAGTVIMDPASGGLTTSATLTPAGGTPHPAKFTTTGSRNSIVLIHVPTSPTTLTRVGGTETMTVSNWTQDGPVNRRFSTSQTFDFQVAGQLNVAAGQADGNYTGTFTITVQYP